MGKNQSDTIDVREDEKLNIQRLQAFLNANASDLGFQPEPFRLRQFGGGMANLTYELTFSAAGRQLVLRRPPLGPVAASAHDMGREFAVLSRLYKAFPLAPRAYLFCEDPTVIGAPFFIMERREGVVVRQKMPAGFQKMPAAGRRLSEALVDALADFHAVDYTAVGLEELGKPSGYVSRQIDGWARRWENARLPEDSADMAMRAVADWLRKNEPDRQAAALVHNDYKLDNVMFDPRDPSKMVAVFDWDMCTLGDPLCDLGALLTYWTDVDDPPYMKQFATTFMPVGQGNFLSRQELIQRYAARSGQPVDEVDFYHVLGLFRLAVIIAQIYIRFVRGQTRDPRFAGLGKLIPLMAKAAVEITDRR